MTSVQKLFNGLTKFQLHKKSVFVGTVLMDDDTPAPMPSAMPAGYAYRMMTPHIQKFMVVRVNL